MFIGKCKTANKMDSFEVQGFFFNTLKVLGMESI